MLAGGAEHQQLSCANCFTPVAFTNTAIVQGGGAGASGKESARVRKFKSKFDSKYAIGVNQGVQTENVLLDQAKIL